MAVTKIIRHIRQRYLLCLICVLVASAIFLVVQFTSNRNSVIAQAPRRQRQAPDFDLMESIIPVAEIHDGGPGKDGIPAITGPEMIPVHNAKYLGPEDRVIGVVLDGEAAAYPLRILNFHEVVNTQVGRIPIRVTYCPLCDSAVVFDRLLDDRVVDFGVSGLLYNSNVLMYDRLNGTKSLWSQLMAKGVSGPSQQVALKTLPLELTTWQDWKTRHPEGTVMSDDTGFRINYARNGYVNYHASPKLMFPVDKTDARLPTKTPVLGIWTSNAALAMPAKAFNGQDGSATTSVGGKKVTVAYRHDSRSLRVEQADEGVQWAYAYWFAWYAFHPETELFSPPNP